jgi:hypothetical protein
MYLFTQNLSAYVEYFLTHYFQIDTCVYVYMYVYVCICMYDVVLYSYNRFWTLEANL